MKLTVFFKSQATRNLALKAVKEVFGEDGWRCMTPVENKGYPADIYCCAAADAVETWAQLFMAFATKYDEILDSSEIVAEYTKG